MVSQIATESRTWHGSLEHADSSLRTQLRVTPSTTTNIQSVVFLDSASQVVFLNSTSGVALYCIPIVLLYIFNDKYFRSVWKFYALSLVFLFRLQTRLRRGSHITGSLRSPTVSAVRIRNRRAFNANPNSSQKQNTSPLWGTQKGFRRRPVKLVKRGFGKRNPFKGLTLGDGPCEGP